jgi:hypothetical protein
MRTPGWKSVAALAVIFAAYYAAFTRAQAEADAKAASVMTALRKAIGGEQKVAAMKGLSLRADYRREMTAGPGGGGGGTMMVVMSGPGGGSSGSSSQATGKIEIDLDLPDKYLRADIGASGFSMTRTEGFAGGRPFLEVVPNTPGMRIQVDNPADDPARAKAAMQRSNADLARLMLGLTGRVQPGFAATYAYAGVAESPDGKADMIDVKGPDGFTARLFVDSDSHLPLMVTYQDAEPRVITRTMSGPQRGSAPGAAAPHSTPAIAGPGTAIAQLTPEQRAELEKQQKEAEAEAPKMVEYRLYFSDYRKVDGVSLPHHFARGMGNKTTEEWDITSYKVNPVFKADRFKVGS